MKSKFEAMSRQELRAYILENREDEEAFHVYMDRLKDSPSTKIYPCPNTPENLEIMKQAIRAKLDELAE